MATIGVVPAVFAPKKRNPAIARAPALAPVRQFLCPVIEALLTLRIRLFGLFSEGINASDTLLVIGEMSSHRQQNATV